jgi:hypothetical protein
MPTTGGAPARAASSRDGKEWLTRVLRALGLYPLGKTVQPSPRILHALIRRVANSFMLVRAELLLSGHCLKCKKF